MPMSSDQIHGNGAIHENAHQRQYSHDEPVEAQEGDQRDHCCAGIGEEHQTQNDPRYSLEQKDPPDVRLLGL
jgi:hypothetical protein